MDTQALLADLSHQDRSTLLSVITFSRTHLSGLQRRSGESYAEHGVEVACVLKESQPDISLLCVAVLHDVLVHPDGKDLLSFAPISDHEKMLVRHMHALRRLHINENTDDLDTVMDAFMEQPVLLPLRMAHRVNDVRHIARFTSPLCKEIAKESLHMYAAIAGRLGMQRWRVELEDGSFPLLQPGIAAKLSRQFEATKVADNLCLQHTKQFLESMLQQHGINAVVDVRIKGHYSTYRKMIIKHRSFEDLTDRLALRIVVEKTEDCYLALGVVHAAMHPIPGKLKDYIGAPKENGYQSIHTVVYPLPGVTEQPMELQIRTQSMHQDCEYGPAAHADYKQTVYALGRKASRVNLFRNLEQLREEATTPQQFEEALRMYFREDHIAVFDADNNIYHIKTPATAMDFARHAYPKKYRRMRDVRINGRKQPSEIPLQDGDTVDIVFGRSNGADDGIRTRDLRHGKATL